MDRFNRALTEGEIKNQFYTAWGIWLLRFMVFEGKVFLSQQKKAQVGESIILRADAAGSQPMAFKWFCSGELLPGSDSSILEYLPSWPIMVWCVSGFVSNAKGKVTSDILKHMSSRLIQQKNSRIIL